MRGEVASINTYRKALVKDLEHHMDVIQAAVGNAYTDLQKISGDKLSEEDAEYISSAMSQLEVLLDDLHW